MRKMFGKKERRKLEPLDLDITSLLDILVILLVFLLKSYNASSLKLDLVDHLKMASSSQRKLGEHAFIIQVDKNNNTWVDKKNIGLIGSPQLAVQLDELLKNRRSPAEQKKETVLPVNLVFDKDLPYKSIQSIMHTCAQSGYTKFKFIIQGNY